MIKSTLSIACTSNGWALFEGNVVLIDGIATRKEAKALLRLARTAERTARSFLLGRETTAGHCDSRCTSAVGPVCVCACLGANHGAGMLV